MKTYDLNVYSCQLIVNYGAGIMLIAASSMKQAKEVLVKKVALDKRDFNDNTWSRLTLERSMKASGKARVLMVNQYQE